LILIIIITQVGPSKNYSLQLIQVNLEINS
jgi:hypothetical protein